MKKFKLLFLILVLFNSITLFSQQLNVDSTIAKPQIKQKLFGNIFTGFYYGLNENLLPRQAFEISTALLGYQVEIDNKVKATLIYDVTKTTSDISVKDTSNNSLEVNYFKGSDYTAFLKQAQIDWAFAKNFEFSVGQLLNQQYLTLQDKFWGYRYVAYTFQEKYKFGSPADFGARVTWRKPDKLNVSIGAVNGDGAFYKQDSKGLLLYNVNVEFFPVKNLTLKFFYDISPDGYLPARMVYSGFVGYKTEKWRVGAEYNQLIHPNYLMDKYYSGMSVYSGVKIYQKLEVIARYDFIERSALLKDNSQFAILGLQYEPAKNFFISVNGRMLNPAEIYQIYVNFGIKF
ncbi:MAG: hypothetical protein HY951_05920 [Bacteroidia bacterium]|nr:hypothetical protein [Bacteroidia bacterium]